MRVNIHLPSWKPCLVFLLVTLMSTSQARAARLLVPMDESQKDHLKSYGIAYWALTQGAKVDWMLNYRNGSFSFPHTDALEKECIVKGVSYEVVSDAQYASIKLQIFNPEANQDIVKLEKPPKIAVYSPKTKQPWDDAVTLVLTYAEIPYDVIFDDEVLDGELPEYDWLHLHHEDFTGQFGKFWASFKNKAWYKEQVREARQKAEKYGYQKVSELKLAVAKKIRDYVIGGGFLFAMCSATDTYDIALAAENVDICANMFDGDPMDRNPTRKLNYQNGFAFRDYDLVVSPYQYEYSSIDATRDNNRIPQSEDIFTLFDFSAKWDPVPTMLCQNHTRVIKGFMGQTTAYRKKYLKPEVLVMGQNKKLKQARYVHGEAGKGLWTFYGGHDPEDYQHMVGEPPTDLSLHPNSPGYRLILNNVLFPAARKKKQKT